LYSPFDANFLYLSELFVFRRGLLVIECSDISLLHFVIARSISEVATFAASGMVPLKTGKVRV
jgi:hypothetical protein